MYTQLKKKSFWKIYAENSSALLTNPYHIPHMVLLIRQIPFNSFIIPYGINLCISSKDAYTVKLTLIYNVSVLLTSCYRR